MYHIIKMMMAFFQFFSIFTHKLKINKIGNQLTKFKYNVKLMSLVLTTYLMFQSDFIELIYVVANYVQASSIFTK